MALRSSWWCGRREGAAAAGRLRDLAGLFEREHTFAPRMDALLNRLR
jgi:hypothetical protein